METLLLDDDTLEDAGYTPPENLRVTRLPDDGVPLAAKVRASYQVAGVDYERELRVVRDQTHSPWRIFRGWAYLAVNTRTVAPLVVAGTRLAKGGSATVAAFPGAYVVSLAQQPFFETASVTAVAGTASAPMLPLRLRSQHQSDLERQVREHLDTCADRSEPDPPDCPFDQNPGVQYPDSFSRKVSHYPRLLLQLTEDATITVTSEAPGRAEVTTNAGAGRSRVVTSESFTVVGKLVIGDRMVKFTPV